MRKFFTITLFFVLTLPLIWANGLNISNQALTGQVNGSHTFVQFDIGWYSWRTNLTLNSQTTNLWDAAWVFVKYKVATADGGDGVWRHATLDNTGHVTPSGATISAPDNKGVFIYRNTDGSGSLTFTGAKLKWNYASDTKDGSTPIADGDQVEVKIFGIEMVYIPQGPFYIGDGDGSNEAKYAFHGLDNNRVQITDVSNFTSATEIRTDNIVASPASGEAPGDLAPLFGNYVKVDGIGGIQLNGTTTNVDYPTGYEPFYVMKYEVTQQQYADFLNCLTYTQQGARSANPSGSPGATAIGSSGRNNIVIQTTGSLGTPAVYSTSTPYLASGWLRWSDGLAYADWAALRPMSELEFEKITHADRTPAVGEYPWGETTISGTSGYTLNSPGTSSESIGGASGSVGNANYNNEVLSPLASAGIVRTGIFTNGSSNIVTSGSTTYGVMDMAGNVWEFVAALTSSTGRGFTGVVGDGDVDTTPANWPTSGAVRGGGYTEPASNLQIADRQFAGTGWTVRASTFSMRCAR